MKPRALCLPRLLTDIVILLTNHDISSIIVLLYSQHIAEELQSTTKQQGSRTPSRCARGTWPYDCTANLSLKRWLQPGDGADGRCRSTKRAPSFLKAPLLSGAFPFCLIGQISGFLAGGRSDFDVKGSGGVTRCIELKGGF